MMGLSSYTWETFTTIIQWLTNLFVSLQNMWQRQNHKAVVQLLSYFDNFFHDLATCNFFKQSPVSTAQEKWAFMAVATPTPTPTFLRQRWEKVKEPYTWWQLYSLLLGIRFCTHLSIVHCTCQRNLIFREDICSCQTKRVKQKTIAPTRFSYTIPLLI